jgi:hypothetical protein
MAPQKQNFRSHQWLDRHALTLYGEFFPTEPGPTALVTMPELKTNERGTAIVQVVKRQLDLNHDGVMDFRVTDHAVT